MKKIIRSFITLTAFSFLAISGYAQTQAEQDAMLTAAINQQKITEAAFNAKRVKTYAFKNPNIIGNEALLIVENNVPVAIHKISTGREGNVLGSGDETLATPNGRFAFIDYEFRNLSTASFDPDHAVVFISVPIPGERIPVEFAVHDSARVTGEPASHGCVRNDFTDDLQDILDDNGGARSGAIHVVGGKTEANTNDEGRGPAEVILRRYGITTEAQIRDLYHR